MTLNVSSEGRETAENSSSAEFDVRLPTTARPFHTVKLMHLELPETRRAVRSGSVLCIEQPVHLSADSSISIAIGDDTYTVDIPATLKTLTGSATTWDVSAGVNGLNLSWPETVYVVSGEDAGQEPTAVSTTQLTVGTSISTAKLWHPPILPSQLVTVINARMQTVLASASASLSLRMDDDKGQVRLYCNRDSTAATVTFPSELGLALLGQSGDVLASPGEEHFFTPKQQYMEMPPGTFTPAALLTFVSRMSGLSLSASTTVATITLSNGETRAVPLQAGFYHGTRLAHALMVQMAATFATDDTFSASFSTSTGKFTFEADAAFNVVFTSSSYANVFGFDTTVLAGKLSYTSPHATFTGEDGLGLVLSAAYYESIRQAAFTPLAAPTVYLTDGINPSASYETTQKNIDGSAATAVHGFKDDDVIIVRKVSDGSELMDTVGSAGESTTAWGDSVTDNTKMKTSVVTHGSGVAVSVRLANQVSRAKLRINSGTAAVRSVGASHDLHVQLGLNRVFTDVFGTTTMPRVMSTAPPTTLAIELDFANSSIVSENLAFADGKVGEGDGKRIFCTVQARQQETFVSIAEEVRVAEIRWAERETMLTVRILDVRDMKLVDFGNGPVRASFALATAGMEDAIL